MDGTEFENFGHSVWVVLSLSYILFVPKVGFNRTFLLSYVIFLGASMPIAKYNYSLFFLILPFILNLKLTTLF